MSLLLMDSCRQNARVGTQWTVVGYESGDASQLSKQCYMMGQDRPVCLQSDDVGGSDDTFIWGARVYMTTSDDQNLDHLNDQLVVLANGGTTHGYLSAKFNDNRQLAYYYAPTDTAIVTTGLGAYPVGSWFYLELKVILHATLGEVHIYVNGQEVASATGVNTTNGTATWTRFWMGAHETNGDTYVCDIYACNSAGAAPFNDILGPVSIESLRPNGAGNYTNWTPSAGTNWEAVDDPVNATSDGDSTYVETTAAERDSYTVQDLASADDPMAVQAKLTGRYVTGPPLTVNTFLRRSATDDDGPDDTQLQSGFEDHAVTIWETDPIAAAAWTNANFDATEFGIRTT